MSKAQCQLREEVIRGEKPLDAVPFDTVRVELKDRWRRLCAVAFTEAFEVGRLLSHVDARRNEIVRDETRDALVRVDLGIQPSTSPSHRRRAEVEQHWPLLFLGLLENTVNVASPGDLHRSPFRYSGPSAAQGVRRPVYSRLSGRPQVEPRPRRCLGRSLVR